jgi:Domain of unknown function (DUF4062)
MKIYISSTFEDLKDYRQAVYNHLRKARHDVIAMEDYVAADKRPLDLVREDVADADVYVGIFAWRYGYVPPHNNEKKRSITELEYRHAANKPRLIFLLSEDAAWPATYMDSQSGESGKGKKIVTLREELQKEHTIGWFKSPEQLVNEVLTALFRVQFNSDVAARPPEAAAPAPPPKPERPRKAEPRQPRPKAAQAAKPSARKDFPLLWKTGSVLRVRFLDGDAKQRNLAKRFMPVWSAYANLLFEFGDDPDAELRVSFAGPGSWAMLGTGALVTSKEANINFGWIRGDTNMIEAERSILHETGHILGFGHEHQNPAGKLPWNLPEVYRVFSGPPNHWSKATVDFSILQTWNPATYPSPKPYDRHSIMMYPMPEGLTTGKDAYFGDNAALSEGDKRFAALLYPY